MAVQTRSRGFPNLTMPPGSGDKRDQPMGSGFSGSNLYANSAIWNTSFSNARERSISTKDPEDNHAAGSSALNANSEADVWPGAAPNPWGTASNNDRPGRSVSTSPNRTRDGAMPNGSSYFDAQSPMLSRGGFGGKTFNDDSNGYAVAFASQKRSTQDSVSAYMDPLSTLPGHREPSLPPSRQSQGSPAFQDLYRAGHTPSNSIHSQRQISNHTTSYSTQSANQRAFNMNKQIEEDVSAQFGRRLALENSNGPSSYAQSQQQAFQLNPGSQPWTAEAPAGRFGGLDTTASDALAAHYAAMKRPSVDRISPAPSYRLESNNSPRSYQPSPDAWSNRSSRDPRIADLERRTPAQQFAAGFHAPYFASPYAPYVHLPPAQFQQGLIDPYGQTFRHHSLMAGYGLAAMPAPYALGSGLPPVRPSREQDPGKGMRSALLDEFRGGGKNSKRIELKDIYNHVVEFSGDQHGSRFIQQKLESANSDEKEQVFREIEPNAIQLMKDVFGNYVVQKFFEHGNQVQKKVLAEKMKGKVVDLSVQVYACRVVQKALEHVLVEQQAELTRELEPDILRVIRDQNGNHVVQKIIELVPRQYINFIMSSLRGQVPSLASHTFGCRVIQRMLEHGTEADKEEIMEELHASAHMLITDQFGNYVAQHVIQNGKPEDRKEMIELVMKQLVTLSKHKFASNVVEKCIENGTAEQRTRIREQLMTVGGDGTSPLGQMMRDQYGNYVIQKLLCQLEGAEREGLVEDIKPQFFSIKKANPSRQIQALEKMLGLGATGEGVKGDGNLAQLSDNTAQADITGVDSAAATPALTNEGVSPQSCSPPSTHVSADGILTDEGSKKLSEQVSQGNKPRVRETDA
ncbi:mRNA binding protein puf3, variant 3 [Purpureocillium takamizusanense]|uniref:Pumilio homology domain family member 3 n=1 Tax=Purpureocillium takamizusanense TaxID=2060973 RepID=A0A9Q8V5S8_9HYPO|nr:mRNA binding protein puf3, variant 3 [Purpureocillium takamizusanense]UNI14075.1 mRNA binding protein puf3, variant 3 [Purpureocillium takamizusanense]